ncbi:MAG: glycosyltransferase family 9 protein [Phycisphaeraceae bacterium]|nr:glycosyltransferase family 9 protein [Phycisphaeraceae bacterium]
MSTDSDRSGPRVLMVRPSALGDVCRTVPALVTLRQAMPNARIDWLVHDQFADAVRHHPALDGVAPFPRQRFARWATNPAVARDLLRWLVDLRHRRYDLVIDLQGLLRSGLFTWASGARRRLGFANARELAWLGYTDRHRVDAKIHTVDRMLRLLECAGWPAVRDMRLHLGEADRQWLAGLELPAYVCLAPTAQWRCKCWPGERYAALAQRMLREGMAKRVVLLAAPHEMADVERIAEAIGAEALLPRTTVGRMLALIAGAKLVIGNDSAAVHAAVGFNKPLVSIFGPTLPGEVGPYQRDDTVVQPAGVDASVARWHRHHKQDQTLIARVALEQVWAKAVEQLRQSSLT